MVSDIDVVDMTHFLKISKDTCILHSFNLHLHMYDVQTQHSRSDIYGTGYF
jgi:hypothetical protein